MRYWIIFTVLLNLSCYPQVKYSHKSYSLRYENDAFALASCKRGVARYLIATSQTETFSTELLDIICFETLKSFQQELKGIGNNL